MYPSAEHFFQAHKSLDPSMRRRVAHAAGTSSDTFASDSDPFSFSLYRLPCLETDRSGMVSGANKAMDLSRSRRCVAISRPASKRST